MKKTVFYCLMLCLLSACSPKITSTIVKKQQTLASADKVKVLGEKDSVPAGYGLMGEIEVNGQGKYSDLLDITREEAWKNGGEYIRVKNYSTSVRSDVHDMITDVYGLGYFDLNNVARSSSYTKPIERVNDSKMEFESYLYLNGGSNSFASLITLGGLLGIDMPTYNIGYGCLFSQKWSCAVGASLSYPSLALIDDLQIVSTGLSVSVARYMKIMGNLYYTPQISVNYWGLTQGDDAYSYLTLGLTPFAFEYQYGIIGFQASAGRFGDVSPVISPTNDNNLYLIANFSDISIGIVLYLR